ncbi:hypothetical protein Zm00014a_022159 [Zea mays]|uniref:Uncharacterized protein n=1 Tax=Zea mays TaxID=4577 RepID=A0A3L6EP54_MAIZE|nr:hypothetical protein Zm00014a_022159 [Zea mays]
MQPVLHRSTATPYSVAPSRSSGGRYQSVTTRLVMGCRLPGSKKVASPKSAIRSRPLSSMRRLEPLMSRCRTPRAWQWLRPSRIWRMRHLTCGSVKRWPDSAARPARSCSMYSKTR